MWHLIYIGGVLIAMGIIAGLLGLGATSAALSGLGLVFVLASPKREEWP